MVDEIDDILGAPLGLDVRGGKVKRSCRFIFAGRSLEERNGKLGLPPGPPVLCPPTLDPNPRFPIVGFILSHTS